jgi:uncharacterized membrane protein SpoIIM required for sporulation
MIIDIRKFLQSEREYWTELEEILGKFETNPDRTLSLDDARRLHYLYQRTASDLAKVNTFYSEPELRSYLERLVAKAYGEINSGHERQYRIRPLHWFFNTFPQTFRRNFRAFAASCGITLIGMLFGALAVHFDPDAKSVIMPFPHLQGTPSERVAREESATTDRMQGHKAAFSTMLMTHNTKVSIFTFALGMTFGFGTTILLFYNGVILGAVAIDYISDGQSMFLLGWLMPHGVIEIPAILLAGQAGLMLAGALIGHASRISMRARLASIAPDIVTLMVGVALMLVWAGIVESYMSQYHAPVLPYLVKIAFGSVELALLVWFLGHSGKPKLEAGK